MAEERLRTRKCIRFGLLVYGRQEVAEHSSGRPTGACTSSPLWIPFSFIYDVPLCSLVLYARGLAHLEFRGIVLFYN